jgi:RNA polymerase sigma factor (sigma-70 family)
VQAAAGVQAGADAGIVTPDPVWDAVAALPPKQRAAITLRFVADLSHAEIAAAMDTSEAAARRNVHEGLTRLRKDYDR